MALQERQQFLLAEMMFEMGLDMEQTLEILTIEDDVERMRWFVSQLKEMNYSATPEEVYDIAVESLLIYPDK